MKIYDINEERLKLWFYYQKERANIYYKKEILKEPSPWTDDPLLQKYFFINVKRILDKETKFALENFLLRDDVSYENKVLNSYLGRLCFSNFKLWRNFKDKYIDFKRLETDSEYKKEIFSISDNFKMFDPAYMMTGGRNLIKDKKDNHIKKSNSYYIERVLIQAKEILEFFDHSNVSEKMNFVQYQVWLDLTYISDYPMCDNDLVVVGPGCRLGIQKLLNDYKNIDYVKFLYWLQENLHSLAKEVGMEWNPKEFLHFLDEKDQYYSLHDLENSFCEFEKYVKMMNLSNKKAKIRYYKNSNKIDF